MHLRTQHARACFSLVPTSIEGPRSQDCSTRSMHVAAGAKDRGDAPSCSLGRFALSSGSCSLMQKQGRTRPTQCGQESQGQESQGTQSVARESSEEGLTKYAGAPSAGRSRRRSSRWRSPHRRRTARTSPPSHPPCVPSHIPATIAARATEYTLLSISSIPSNVTRRARVPRHIPRVLHLVVQEPLMRSAGSNDLQTKKTR